MNGHSRYQTHVFGRKITEQNAAHWPVDHVDALAVARPDGQVGPIDLAGLEQARQVLGVVRKVRVHLKNILVVLLEGPLEAVDVGGTQAQLALALVEVYASRMLSLHLAHQVGRAVGRIVVDDEQVEGFRQCNHSLDDGLDVLAFLVGGYDDQSMRHAAKVGFQRGLLLFELRTFRIVLGIPTQSKSV